MPTVPPIAIALALGAGAFFVWQWAFGPKTGGGSGAPGHFVTDKTSRFWDSKDAAQTAALKAKLASLKATPIPGVERAWQLGPAGVESALARVQAIQGAGSFAVSTDNLLSPTGPWGLSQVLATEVGSLAPASGTVAVLPTIV